jgi:N-acyl-D-aspartate/D-glutamate deacylase
LKPRYSLVIRNGQVVDGLGGEPRYADVGVVGDKIAAIGRIDGIGAEEIDADGTLVTPGFIDPHTHLDFQMTWADRAIPCSWQGVTTAMMGNCGVGFAPCPPEYRETLIGLMEGVEDIPAAVMRQGLPWNWESFPEFIGSLASRSYDVDLITQIPHSPLRVAVMGERGVNREPATDADLNEMRRLVAEAVRAGAFGVSSSRSRGHIDAKGRPVPSFDADEKELASIAMGLSDAGEGWFQIIPDFADLETEFAMLRRVVTKSRRPMSLSVMQLITKPDEWRRVLELVEAANAAGDKMYSQVIPRATGVLLGFEVSQNPFMARPSYAAIAHLPLDRRMEILRDPAFRAKVLSESMPVNPNDAEDLGLRIAKWDRLFPLNEPLNYEPDVQDTVAARAARAGVPPDQIAYDHLLQHDGRALLYRPFSNYGYGNLDAVREMIADRNSIIGLGDAGAHLRGLSDASSITFMITHWTRDRQRGDLVPIEWAVKRLTRDTAVALGLNDRGVLAPGFKADINVIDYDALKIRRPEVLYDLPGGGGRLVQRADGYVATVVSGVPVYRSGKETGELPGRVVRGAQAAPPN